MSNICSNILTKLSNCSTLVLNKCSNRGVEMKLKGAKITVGNRKKAFISLFSLTLLLMIAILSMITQTQVNGSDDTVYAEYKVQEGDTLWSIASEYNNGKDDIRETVYLIGQINGKEDGYIKYGEILKVPLQ